MKTAKKLEFIALLAFLGSCASNIKTKKTTDVSFSELNTFAYLPNTNFEMKTFNSNFDDSVELGLISTLNNEMIQKGYSMDNENPDLVFLLRTKRELNSNENTKSKYERASGGSSGGSPNFATTGNSGGKRYISSEENNTLNKPSKKGTLIVEVYSSKNKDLLWVGTAKDFKSHISDQTFMERMLKEILKRFPE